MKHLMLLAGLAILCWGVQQSLPQVVVDSDQKLQSAKSLTAGYTLQVVGDAPSTYELVFMKPNFFKLTGPDGWVLSDGKTIYEYTAKDKTWTEKPLDDAALKAFANRPEVWGWQSFFLKDALKDLGTAKAGAVKNIKGNLSTEVVENPKDETKEPVTVYIDQKLGLVRSYRMKIDATRELLVQATDLELGTEPLDPSQFVFVAPAGAKKAEPAQAAAATFSSVQALLNSNCMPCHNGQTRKGGVELTDYDGVVAVVQAGNAPQSLIIKSLRGNGAKKMPMGRPSLPEPQIKLIEDWISAGAKP